MLDDRMQRTRIARDDWGLGRSDAPVTVLEYGDFECPYCGAARPPLEALVAENPDTVRLIYRHFPIANLHPHATQAAEAAEAAGAQGKFWAMHDMLFSHQDALEYEDLRVYADEIGLDLVRFDQEMEARTYQLEVLKDLRRGIQDGVNGTPAIFINGLRYDGPRDDESMLTAVFALLAARDR
jgi:protein-disulfide isomerase